MINFLLPTQAAGLFSQLNIYRPSFELYDSLEMCGMFSAMGFKILIRLWFIQTWSYSHLLNQVKIARYKNDCVITHIHTTSSFLVLFIASFAFDTLVWFTAALLTVLRHTFCNKRPNHTTTTYWIHLLQITCYMCCNWIYIVSEVQPYISMQNRHSSLTIWKPKGRLIKNCANG